ncbi:cysteine hydrolase family protein [Mycoplasmopsis edwardii]|nr:isochorismatase family cysteine hydrolase [Mycoplasmopsis edwardii]
MKKSVIFVIDLINGFAKSGALYDKRIKDIIPDVKDIIDKSDSEVHFVCDAHSKDDIEMEQYPPHCIKGTEESEVVDELKFHIKSDGSNVTFKTTTNGFFVVKKSYLRQFDEFILTGCCTDICIMQFGLSLKTWLNKNRLNKDVIIYEEGVQTFDSKDHNGDLMHKFALDVMKNAGIKIRSWKDK